MNERKPEIETLTVHSCISCSFVASLITRMFSLRADSCCCCFSFSSDSLRPVTSLAMDIICNQYTAHGNSERNLKRSIALLKPVTHQVMNSPLCMNVCKANDQHLLTIQIGVFRFKDLDIGFMLFPPKILKEIVIIDLFR